jgi:hypothetical protein
MHVLETVAVMMSKCNDFFRAKTEGSQKPSQGGYPKDSVFKNFEYEVHLRLG